MSEDKYTQTFDRAVLVDFYANVATAMDECADRAVAIADYLREEKRLLSDEFDLLGYSELPEGDEGVTLWIGKADAVNAMWDTLVMLTANYLHMIDNTKEDDDEVE